MRRFMRALLMRWTERVDPSPTSGRVSELEARLAAVRKFVEARVPPANRKDRVKVRGA